MIFDDNVFRYFFTFEIVGKVLRYFSNFLSIRATEKAYNHLRSCLNLYFITITYLLIFFGENLYS